MSRILSCLSGMATTDDRPKALWTADDEAHLPLRLSDGDRKPGCIFCDVSVERGFAVVYSDDELIASHDRSPRAAVHLLIIPRRHVDSVRSLTQADVSLLESLTALAHTLSESLSAPPASTDSRALPTNAVKMGFHIPPFSSVPHLHLHVLVPPLTVMGRLKYPYSRPLGAGRRKSLGKGWGWFVEVDQARDILERGGKIRVGRS